MIVKCEQCQTRFKIPDDKVTDKGVKVRCTKCGHTFRVAKDGVAAPGSSPSGVQSTQTFPVVPAIAPVAGKATLPPKSVQLGGGEEDPFSAFGRPPSIPDDEATRPGVFVLGVEASRVPEMGAPPIPPQAPPTPAVGSAFDFSSLVPPSSAAAAAPAPPPVPRPVPRSSSPTAQVPPVAAPPQPAPFDFSALVPSAPPAPAQPAPFDFSALGASPAVPVSSPSTPSFDFSSLGPGTAAEPPPPPPPAAPVGPPPPVPSTPAFDFSGLGPPPAAPTLPAGLPLGSQPGVPGPTAPLAAIPRGSQPGVPSIPTGSQPGIPRGTQPGVARQVSTAVLPPIPAPAASTTGAQPAIAAPWGTTGSNPAYRPQSSAPFEGELGGSSEARTDAVPALFGGQPAAHGADDFFGGSMPVEEKRAPLPDDLQGDEAKNALFDMAAALPPAPAEEPAPQASAAPVAVARITPVRAAPEAEAPRRRRTALGIVVNLFIAAVLVVALVVVGSAYLNEGKVSADTLSWDHLKATFAPSTDFVAGDISNGLYDTRAGKPVFFVRGEVTNRGSSAVKVMVKAELLEGSTLVRAAESAAGAPPSPEELFVLASADDLDALNAKVSQRAPVLEPGATAPFTVTFFEYPPDLKGFRVRVSAWAATGSSTATREP